jgi:fimbrial chaperone protein
VSVNGVNAKNQPPMIAPFAAVDVALNAGKVTNRSAKGIEIGLINDYGATVSHVYPIQK